MCCDWHMKPWLRETRLSTAWHGYVLCDCGRHFSMPESCVKFRPLENTNQGEATTGLSGSVVACFSWNRKAPRGGLRYYSAPQLLP